MVYHEPRDFGPGAWEFVGLGGILVTSLVLGLAVGLYTDFHVGTSPTFTLLGIGLGMLLGGYASWLRVRRFFTY